jgi:nucleoside-diphosphate-sugar epimerase
MRTVVSRSGLRQLSPAVSLGGDYVFVADVVAANLAAAMASGLPHSEYNIGTDTGISLLELAEEVALAAGIDLNRWLLKPWMRAPAAGLAQPDDRCRAAGGLRRSVRGCRRCSVHGRSAYRARTVPMSAMWG